MASKTIARTLQIHGDFIKEIYGAVGISRLPPGASRRSGVDIPPGVCLSRFRNAGIFTLVGRSAGQKAIWRLSPGVLEYCATQEVTA